MSAVQIRTPQGPAEVLVHPASRSRATLVLTHGAGGDVDAADLAALATTLPGRGVSVCLVRMPWRVAGKKLAPRPPVIDECYAAVLEGLDVAGDLVLGGRSAGARSACRIASTHRALGVVALSFPLHPPGKPEKSRLAELTGAGVPTLVVQGERDPFGRPEEYPAAMADRIVVVTAADHSLKVPRRAGIGQDEAMALVGSGVAAWLDDVLGNQSG